MTEHKLLMKTVWKNYGFLAFLSKFPIQHKKFKYGVIIRNLGDIAFPGGEIVNIRIHSAEQTTIYHRCTNRYPIPLIPAKKSTKIIFENLVTPLDGNIWLSMDVKAEDNGIVLACRYDEANSETLVCPNKGTWGENIFVIPQFNHQQQMTNFFLVILTTLAFIHGTWGLDQVVPVITKPLLWFISVLDIAVKALLQLIASLFH